MSHTQPSKQNSTSEFDYWFKKNNYMSKFLTEHSRKIIEKHKNKKHDG